MTVQKFFPFFVSHTELQQKSKTAGEGLYEDVDETAWDENQEEEFYSDEEALEPAQKKAKMQQKKGALSVLSKPKKPAVVVPASHRITAMFGTKRKNRNNQLILKQNSQTNQGEGLFQW